MLRVVIPYSELRTNPVPTEKHLKRVIFVPTEPDAVATEFSFVFISGESPPGWPGLNHGTQPLCCIKLPNNDHLFVVYLHHREDSLFREALRQARANRQEFRRIWTELRGQSLGPYFREGVITTCTDGSVVIVEVAGD